MSVVRTSVVRNPLRYWQREQSVIAWASGMRVRDAAPSGSCDSGWPAFVNGADAEWDDELRPGDHVAFVAEMGLPISVPALLLQIAVGAAVSFVFSKLFPPPGQPKSRDDAQSPTYSFLGISNNRVDGQPIPIVYGEMRVGGQIINEYVDVRGFGNSTSLYMLFALSEGIIQSVGGAKLDTGVGTPLRAQTLPDDIKINGNNAENYDDLLVNIRKGSNEQEVIPGFEQSRQTFVVEQTLTQEEGSSADATQNLGGGFVLAGSAPFDTTNDAVWDEHGVSFDLDNEDVDSFVARINFPQGYFRQDDTTGALIDAFFGFQVRYRELDAGNNPITTGGPNGDGYVRLPPSPLIGFTRRGAFNFQYDHQFLDPQSYESYVAGNALEGGGATDSAEAAIANAYPYVGNGSAQLTPGLSCSVWVRFRNNALDFTGTSDLDWLHIVGNYGHGNRRGWSIGLERHTYTDVNFGTVFRWTWGIEAGDEAGRSVIEVPPGSQNTPPDSSLSDTDVDRWYHVFISYGHDVGGSNDRYRMWINGDRVFDRTRDHAMRATGSQSLKFLRNANGLYSSTYIDARIDDLHLWWSPKGDGLVQRMYNEGSGYTGTDVLVVGDALVTHYNFNAATSLTQQVDASVAWYDDIVLSGATSGSADGVVGTVPAGTPLKSQYRVEMLRYNRISTNARTTNDAQFAEISGIVDVALAYPGLALASLQVTADDQLNGTIPTVTWKVKGILVPHLDDELTTPPIFKWSANPAWIAYDIVTNPRYGLGQFYGFDDVDKAELRAWALYCDEVVYDGRAQLQLDGDGFNEIFFYNDYEDPVTGIVRGRLQIDINTNDHPSLPDEWEVGRYIRLTGFPDGTGEPNIDNDVNNSGAPDGFTGYEIYSILRTTVGGTTSVHTINCYWDRTDETDPWLTTTGMSANLVDAADLDGFVEGGEHRFEFNGVFDRVRNAWDALLEVCAVGRCVPIQIGDQIRFKYAHARDPVGVVSIGAIIPESFEIQYGGLKDRPNAIDLTILDRHRGYEQTPVPVVHSSLDNPTSFNQVRRDFADLFGVTNRSQAERHGKFLLNANALIKRQGSFKLGATGLQYESGDLVHLAHDVLPRGGLSGRVSEDGGEVTIHLDRDFTLEAGESYTLYVLTSTDKLVSGTVTTAAGSFLVGDPIQVTALGENPRKGDLWILVKTGDELTVEITDINVQQDLTRSVSFIEYNADVFDDQLTEPLSEQASIVGGGLLDPDDAVSTLPTNVEITHAEDRVVRTTSGALQYVVSVSWIPDRSTVPRTAHTNVYVRNLLDVTYVEGMPVRRTRWTLAATVHAPESSTEIVLSQGVVGSHIEVAVQPVMHDGSRRRPEVCAVTSVYILGVGPYPAAPTLPRASIQSEKALYGWSLGAGQRGDVVEIRRGRDHIDSGWILAPSVYESTPGSTVSEATRDFSGMHDVVSSRPSPRLMFRAKNGLGQRSSLTTLNFDPTPKQDSFPFVVLTDTTGHWHLYSSNNWIPGAPVAGDPTLTDLIEHADGYLQFDAALTGTWTGAFDSAGGSTLDIDRRPKRQFIEAVLQVEQIHAIEWGEVAWGWGDPRLADRWTWEGPTHLFSGESECSVRIEMRLNVDGTTASWEGWQDFRPGIYTFVDVQFRLTCTRPTVDFDMKIHKFSTRVTAPPIALQERSPYQAALEREVF